MTRTYPMIPTGHRLHTHRARPSLAQYWGYARPVAYPENRAAHGNITRQDVCKCGARRLSNINGRHVERGPWRDAEDRPND